MWCSWGHMGPSPLPPAVPHISGCSKAAGPPTARSTQLEPPPKTEQNLAPSTHYPAACRAGGLTLSRPNSQARSRGVFFNLLTRHGLDWCWRSISDWEGKPSKGGCWPNPGPWPPQPLRQAHLPPHNAHTARPGAEGSDHPARQH